MITTEMLDTLSDDEIIVFDKVLRFKKNRDICFELEIKYHHLKYLLNRIYFKLKIDPRSQVNLRMVWDHSVKAQKFKFRGYKVSF